MSFEIGDKVFVLDEDISGEVTRILGDSIAIETTDGFVLEFSAHELVKSSSQNTIKNELLSGTHAFQGDVDKEQPVRRKQLKKRAKERYEPTMEVDLHIHQLVKSTKGMSNYDMLTLQLDTAKRQLEYAMSKRIQKVVFIHGIGEGVLRVELKYLFGRYNNVKYYDANYQKYGLGATEVYIYQNVSRD